MQKLEEKEACFAYLEFINLPKVALYRVASHANYVSNNVVIVIDSFPTYIQYFLLLIIASEHLSIYIFTPQFLPYRYFYCSLISLWYLSILLQTNFSIYTMKTTFTSRYEIVFTNWNDKWYILVGKHLDIIYSSTISTYDIDKTHNIILKIP